MKKIIITEKPEVMRQIVAVLEPTAQKISTKYKVNYYKGNHYIFVSVLGHIINFKYPKEIKEEYKTYWNENMFPYNLPDPLPMKVDENKIGYYKVLKEVIEKEKYDEIIVATDGDREGQGIYERIKAFLPRFPLNIKESRIWLSEWTDEGFQKAFNNRFPNSDMSHLKDAAYLRAMEDYYIGMNGTGICTVKFGGPKNIVNIGRVQTAVGKIIELREKSIINFVSEDYKALSLQIESDEKTPLILKHKLPSDKRLKLDEAKKIIDQINKIDNVKILTQSREIQSKPYKLCDAMDIQKEMNKLYGYSANKTASLLQTLYQSKRLTTYPGTKAHEISVSSAKMDTKPLQNLRGMGVYDDLIEKVFQNNWHIADHCITSKGLAHEAITPVFGNISKDTIDSLTNDEMNVYKAVVRRYLQAFYPNAVYNVTKVVTQAAGEAFESTGKMLMKEGYLEVVGKKSDTLIPKVTNESFYKIEKIICDDKQTSPPPRYTEGTLLDAMKYAGRFIEDQKYADILNDENVEGLGTGRTRGKILEGMKDHGFFTIKGKTIYPTPKLMDLMHILPNDIAITSPMATAKMEESLNDVEEGRLSAEKYKDNIIKETRNMVDSIKQKNSNSQVGEKDYGMCPECGKPLRKRKGKYGDFIGCSGYPDCTYIKPKEKEKETKTGNTCPNCGRPMVKKRGRFGFFEACSGYPTCKYIAPKDKQQSEPKETGEKCPNCGKPMVLRNGKYGQFKACSGYPKCKYIEK